MKAAVLGCGPAGLAAVHAINLSTEDADIVVYSKKRKSDLYGAQYLHAPIPGVTMKGPVAVHAELLGTVVGYRRKVYGDTVVDSVSPEQFAEEHLAWDIRQTYDALWESYQILVYDTPVNSDTVQIMINMDFDLIVNTIPLSRICRDPKHDFATRLIYAEGDAPERGRFIHAPAAPNSMVMNGYTHVPWYRKCTVFGYSTTEWPARAFMEDIPALHAVPVHKPLSTDCDCWPSVLRVGRYGKWEKGVLVHQAFEEVMTACVALRP